MKRLLLIVDPQNDFINGPLAVPGAEAAMNALAGYVAENAHRYCHIAVTCDMHPASHCSFAENGGPWPAHCIADTQGAEIWAGLAAALPRGAEILRKGENPDAEEYSIFRNPHGRMRLMDLIGQEKIGHCDICGLAGDYCVLQTLKDGVEIFGAERFSTLDSYIASLDGGKTLSAYLQTLA